MGWLKYHRKAEALAQMADVVGTIKTVGDAGDVGDEAEALYWSASIEEVQAYKACPIDMPRTLSILAVSALALIAKSKADPGHVVVLGESMLKRGDLQPFAVDQIDYMVAMARQKLEGWPSPV